MKKQIWFFKKSSAGLIPHSICHSSEGSVTEEEEFKVYLLVSQCGLLNKRWSRASTGKATPICQF